MTPVHKENIIELRNIRSLSALKFYIPDYQRGYRWTDTQANQMLQDFLDFIEDGKDSTKYAEGYYCLQPVVVKPKTWISPDGTIQEGYEVIDGQQRLTTIYLLLQALFSNDEKLRKRIKDFNMFSIDYQTRNDSKDFLENIADDSKRQSKKYDCIDFYHINMVYETFLDALSQCEDLDADRDLISMLLNEKPAKEGDDDDEASEIDKARNARLIWYEIGFEEKASSEDIFTRLNVGKIPLTNAELIKAMFLRESNFGKVTATRDNERETQKIGIALQQNKIAEDWNIIEQKLQQEDFWYFLGGASMGKEYETRIEFIFDLMANWDQGKETYHTFIEFQNRIKSVKKKPAENVWKDVKDYFRDLEYWYNDRILYHLIGFLIQCGKTIADIKELEFTEVADEDGKNTKVKQKKDRFIANVKDEIKKSMKNINLDTLKYLKPNPNPNITKVLLLFNVLSVIDSTRSDIKFPFDKFKKEHWDQEHIASQTDKDSPDVPNKKAQRVAWINDMLYYFTGQKEPEGKNEAEKALELIDSVKKFLAENSENDELTDNEVEIIKSLIDVKGLSILGPKKITADEKQRYDDTMKELFIKMRHYFNDNKITEEDKDLLGNMVLLNSTINRSYGNAFFAIKRMHIQEYDSQGVFIPLATKNVFMKYYSKRVNEMLTWTTEDAKAYLAAIKGKLQPFLKTEDNGNK
ncbi:MAG: DUF262 domain-containing protein [Muribaculaceae bacterium]|nr:DUF262 domain-containing protein [Muribaculaceae bacterium]